MLRNSKGQSMIEYLIIVGLVAVGCMVVMQKLGQTVSVRFANVTNALQGVHSNQPKAESITQDDTRKRNLGDFFSETPGH